MFPRTSNELDKNTSQVTGNTTHDALNTLLAAIGAIYQIPAGTAMLFVQASAPVGWTKSTAQNDKALRIVSGSGGGTGGSSPFSTVFGKTATDNHTLTSSQQASMSVSASVSASGSGAFTVVYDGGLSNPGINLNLNQAGGGPSPYMHATNGGIGYTIMNGVSVSVSGSATGTASGGGSAHNHSMDIRVQYVDAIICTKD